MSTGALEVGVGDGIAVSVGLTDVVVVSCVSAGVLVGLAKLQPASAVPRRQTTIMVREYFNIARLRLIVYVDAYFTTALWDLLW